MKAFVILFFAAAAALSAQTADRIKNIFEETKQHLKSDKAQMWGVGLYGPLMFVDPETRVTYTNEQDEKKTFTEKDGVYVGKLDYKENIANTTLTLDGKHWTMVMLPLPENLNERRTLIIHELFHSAQDKLNLNYRGSMPGHLEKRHARELLRLEWEALFQALKSDNTKEKKHHAENALIFRQARRAAYKEADQNENCFELGEGLAEYTGMVLGIDDDTARINYLTKTSRMMLKDMKPVVRSFGYISGPLYALILDKSGMDWRKSSLPDSADLGKLLMKAYNISIDGETGSLAQIRKKEYGYTEIELTESEREKENDRKTSDYIKTFVKSPVLRVALSGGHFQFNPMEVVSLDSLGNVYPSIRASGKWGVLTVEKGALMQPDWVIAVTLPFSAEGGVLTGDGWKLELNKDWDVIKTGESYKLVKK